MIIDFKIKNFRSYKDETEFSFEALDMDFRSENTTAIELENGETIRLLKTAARSQDTSTAFRIARSTR